MWWNPNYPFRRRLQIVPSADGINSGHPITYNVPVLLMEQNKIRDDGEDIEIVYQTDDIVQLLDRELIIEEDVITGVKFPLVTSLIDTSLDYYIYYGNFFFPSPERPEIVLSTWPVRTYPTDPAVTFTRPGEHWKNSISDVAGARATYQFYGERVRLFAKVGPDQGIAEIQLDNLGWEYVDLFAMVEAEETEVWSKTDLEPGYHEVQIRVSGTQHPASVGYYVNIKYFEQSRAVSVADTGEEIFDYIWSAGTGGI